jgi:hypothetical protein
MQLRVIKEQLKNVFSIFLPRNHLISGLEIVVLLAGGVQGFEVIELSG